MVKILYFFKSKISKFENILMKMAYGKPSKEKWNNNIPL